MYSITRKDLKISDPLVWIVDHSVNQPKKTLLLFGLVIALFMIPFSQLAVDSSYDNVVGDDGPEGMTLQEDLVERFGEQEIATVVVDCSNSDQSTAESFIKELADRLNDNKYFRDIDYLANIEIPDEKVPLYVPEENLAFLLDPNATMGSIEENYTALISAFNTPRFIVSENGRIYLLNMIINEDLGSQEARAEVFDNLFDTVDEGKGSIPTIVQNTGKAIFLTTATTCLAFSTFLFAAHPGLRTLGPVSVLGIGLCFIASIFLLPALLVLMDRRKQ